MDKERVTQIIMHEIGLDVDDDNNIIDQDNGQQLFFNGKTLKYNSNIGVCIGKNDIPFNPLDDVKIMSHLFSYYLNKKNEEDGLYFPIYFTINGGDGRSSLEIKGDKTLVSKFYKNETLKYIDLIMRINGDENIDLTDLDE